MNAPRETPLTDAFATALYHEACAAAADLPEYSGVDRSPEESYGMALDFARSLERTVAELRKYARHNSDCHLVMNLRNRETGELIPVRYRKCTCGLDALLARLEGK